MNHRTAMLAVGALAAISMPPQYYPDDYGGSFHRCPSTRKRADGQYGGMSAPSFKGEIEPERYGKRARRRRKARGQ